MKKLPPHQTPKLREVSFSGISREVSSKLTCQDVISLLFEYLDKEIEEEMVYRIETHRTTCPSCTKLIKSFRLIINYLRETEEKEVPEDVHNSLLTNIRQRGVKRGLRRSCGQERSP